MLPSTTPSLQESAYRVRTSIMHAVLDILGDPWNLSIVRETLHEARRFDALVNTLGVSRPALSKRLERLCEDGILTKTAYCENPRRFDYRATPMGQGLRPVLLLLQQWNVHWLKLTAPITEHCPHCRSPLQLKVLCASCNEELHFHHVKPLSYQTSAAVLPAIPGYRRTRHQVASKERENAPLAITAEAWLQDRWSALILGGMLFGLQRYGDFLTALAIAPNILSGRLEVLQQAALVRHLEDGRYRLRERGYGLYPAIMAMRDWGWRWLKPQPALEQGWGLLHKPCVEWLSLQYACKVCGGTLSER